MKSVSSPTNMVSVMVADWMAFSMTVNPLCQHVASNERARDIIRVLGGASSCRGNKQCQ